MDLRVPDSVTNFAESARGALQAVSAADRKGLLRVAHTLGVEGLDCAANPEEALAAGHFAAEVGRLGAQLPVAALLTGAAAGRSRLMSAVGPARRNAVVNHLDLDSDHLVVRPDGATQRPGVVLETGGSPVLAPHAALVSLDDAEVPGDRCWWQLYLTFCAFHASGAIESAIELTVGHVKARTQFGRPLAQQQAIQHHLADAAAAHRALWELAHFTLLGTVAGNAASYADTLVLRAAHIEAVNVGFGHLHQATGAVGFTDEYLLSRLSVSVQLDKYLPMTLDETLAALGARLQEMSFIYPLASVGGAPSPSAQSSQVAST